MIDLHCHLLSGIDDGAADLHISLEMARLAVAEGITTTACTPHILPGVYDNTGSAIRAAVARLQLALDEAEIPLHLVAGADIHVAPDLISGLRSGRMLALNDSRYLLFEPPHHIVPPRFDDCIFGLMAAGYVPILTHPERLSWINSHFELIQRLARSGVWMQLTAGSLLGRFGRRARYWSERMLDDELFHVMATDAHNIDTRAPLMTEAHDVLAQRVGAEEARHFVETRPQGILDDVVPSQLPLPGGARKAAEPDPSFWRRALQSFVSN